MYRSLAGQTFAARGGKAGRAPRTSGPRDYVYRMTVLVCLYCYTVHSSQDHQLYCHGRPYLFDEGRGSLVPRLLSLCALLKKFLHHAHGEPGNEARGGGTYCGNGKSLTVHKHRM